jgi:superfamily I DNA and/or RNA helicase
MEKDAKLTRAIPEGSRPKCVQEFGEDELEILDRLDMAKVIHDEYQRATATRFESIYDKRVTNLEISLGNRMLQVAGIALDFTNKPEGDCFPWAKPNDSAIKSFVDSYRAYLCGEEMTRDSSKVFTTATKRLAELTMDGAEVLASTLATAATPLVSNAYSKVEGLVIDEAARVVESQSWPIMEKYGELVWKLLVGDPDQLPPVIQSNERTNPFAGQLRLSQMHRLESAGATTVFLPKQARAPEEIAKAYSRIIYQGRVTHAPSTAVERRPIAQAVRAFNLKRRVLNKPRRDKLKQD